MADEDKDHLQAEVIEVKETYQKSTKIISSNDQHKVVQKHLEQEEQLEKKQREDVANVQRQQFEKELDKNARMKQELIDEFKESMKNTSLSPAEQAAMLAEMNAKIS